MGIAQTSDIHQASQAILVIGICLDKLALPRDRATAGDMVHDHTERPAGAGPSSPLVSGLQVVTTYGSASSSGSTASAMAKQPLPEIHAVPIADVESFDNGIEDRITGSLPIASIDKNEPIVTRRELWSYYCVFSKSHFCLDYDDRLLF